MQILELDFIMPAGQLTIKVSIVHGSGIVTGLWPLKLIDFRLAIWMRRNSL